jgi:hypothetical protein
MKTKIIRLGSLITAAFLLISGSAYAATPAPNPDAGAASDNGLKIAPVRSDITVEAGTSRTVTVTVTNVTSSISSYDVLINDFTAGSDESGQPQILLDADKFAPSHSLKRLVGEVPGVTLNPGDSKNVNVTITVPKDYPAGGYYGAIRLVPHTEEGAVNQNVTLSASVGSLVLVTVPGNINQQVSVASLDVRKSVNANEVDVPRTIFTNNKDLNAVIRFQNGGDVQEQPFGKLTLKNWRGKTIATYEVNETKDGAPRGNVLPDSIRKFNTPLDKVGSFGKYSLEGNFGYGDSGQLITASSSFYVIPLAVILAFVGLIAAILFAIFLLPRIIRRYNKRVVAKSRKRR